MKNFSLLILLGFYFFSCDSKLSDPQKIVDKAIEVGGGEKYNNLNAEFDFRNIHYVAKRDGGSFSYERILKDSIGTIHDFVTNEGFKREVNGEVTMLPDSMTALYT
ncbi:MAG: DUF6503 family protein, partial [Cyclobacteriaceae bacterium]